MTKSEKNNGSQDLQDGQGTDYGHRPEKQHVDHEQRAVFAAMMEELGIGRMDTLPLYDRNAPLDLSTLPNLPKMEENPLSIKWNTTDLIDDALEIDGIDSMADGQLFRRREQARADISQQMSHRGARGRALLMGSTSHSQPRRYGQNISHGQVASRAEGEGRRCLNLHHTRAGRGVNSKALTHFSRGLLHQRGADKARGNANSRVSSSADSNHDVRSLNALPTTALPSPETFLAFAGITPGSTHSSSRTQAETKKSVPRSSIGGIRSTLLSTTLDEKQKASITLLTASIFDQKDPADGLPTPGELSTRQTSLGCTSGGIHNHNTDKDNRIAAATFGSNLISLSENEADDIGEERKQYITNETCKDLEGLSLIVDDESAAAIFQAMDKYYDGGFAGRRDDKIRDKWIEEAHLDPVKAKRVLGRGLAASMFADQSCEGDLDQSTHLGVEVTEEYLSRSLIFNSFNTHDRQDLARQTYCKAPDKYHRSSQAKQPLAIQVVKCRSTIQTQDDFECPADGLKHARPGSNDTHELTLSIKKGSAKATQDDMSSIKMGSSLSKERPVQDLIPGLSITTQPIGCSVGESQSSIQLYNAADKLGTKGLGQKRLALKTAAKSQDMNATQHSQLPLIRAVDFVQQADILRAMSGSDVKTRVTHNRTCSSEMSASADGQQSLSMNLSADQPPTASSAEETRDFRRHKHMGSDLDRLNNCFGDLTISSDPEAHVMEKIGDTPRRSIAASELNIAVSSSAGPSRMARTLFDADNLDNRNLKEVPGLKSSMWATPGNLIKIQSPSGKTGYMQSSSSNSSHRLNASAPAWTAGGATQADPRASKAIPFPSQIRAPRDGHQMDRCTSSNLLTPLASGSARPSFAMPKENVKPA